MGRRAAAAVMGWLGCTPAPAVKLGGRRAEGSLPKRGLSEDRAKGTAGGGVDDPEATDPFDEAGLAVASAASKRAPLGSRPTLAANLVISAPDGISPWVFIDSITTWANLYLRAANSLSFFSCLRRCERIWPED